MIYGGSLKPNALGRGAFSCLTKEGLKTELYPQMYSLVWTENHQMTLSAIIASIHSFSGSLKDLTFLSQWWVLGLKKRCVCKRESDASSLHSRDDVFRSLSEEMFLHKPLVHLKGHTFKLCQICQLQSQFF